MGRPKKIKKENEEHLGPDHWDGQEYEVELEFITSLLATKPNKKVYMKWLAGKQVEQMEKEGKPIDEIRDAVRQIEEGLGHHSGEGDVAETFTTFCKDDKGIYLEAYMLKAFFKNAAWTMKKWGETTNLRSLVVKYLFVTTPKVYVEMPEGGVIEKCERPIRCQTAQGERISIGISDEVPAGTKLNFKFRVLKGQLGYDLIRALLDYGHYVGIGQWRTGDHGQFKYKIRKV